MRFLFLIACAASILLSSLSGVVAAEALAVETVTVSVLAGDAPPPGRVIKRMEQSIVTVGDHVLTGRKVAEVESGKASYEKLIKEIFDRVLVGYSVQEVNITPGTTSHIAVRIQPWGDIVRNVTVETDLGGVSPQLAALFKRDMGDIEGKVSEVLVGMPVESVDWAGGVTKTVIREYLAGQLPEYRTNVEINAGQTTTVKLALVPSGPVVKDVRVTLRSQSIPNFLLIEARSPVEEAGYPLRGLPVAFIERHSDYFKDMLLKVAAAQPVTERYGLKLSSALRVGATTELEISAETTRYNVALEGYLDMGRNEKNDTSARLHVGRYLSNKDELFMEVTFIPASMTWEFVPGLGHRLGPQTMAGIKYSLSDKLGLLWLKQDLSERWSLRLERTPATGINEAGLRYRLHEFLSAEYIFTNHNRWLRLVGNL